MAITINKQPAAVCFAKNQQIVKLQSNLFVEIAATKGVFTFDHSINYGTPIVFRFWGKLVYFTVSASPVLDGFTLPSHISNAALNGLGGTAERLARFANYFKANFDINTEFDVTSNASLIYFTSKKYGLDTTALTNQQADDLTGNSLAFSYTPGVNLKLRDNFKILIEVYAGLTTTTYEKIYSAELLPKQINSSIELNIEEVLRSRLDYDILDYRNNLSWANKIIRNFYFTCTEHYGTTAINHIYKASNVFKALNAGVSARNYPTAKLYLLGNLKTRDYFLDLQNHRNMIADANLPHILFFLAEGTIAIGAEINIFSVVTWDDNTTSNYTLSDTTRSLGNDVLIVPCGIPNTNLKGFIAANPTKTAIKYVISVNAIANAKRTFIIDNKYYKSLKYFRYVNSMGGLTHFRTTGEYEYGVEISFDEFEKEIPIDYTTTKGSESSIYNSFFEETFEVFSGWVSRYDVFLFIDFLLSEKKQEILIANDAPENYNYKNEILEIKTEPGSVKLYKSKDGLYSYSFKYKYMNKSRAMNNQDAIPTVSTGNIDNDVIIATPSGEPEA